MDGDLSPLSVFKAGHALLSYLLKTWSDICALDWETWFFSLLARWAKGLMAEAGVETSVFEAHSACGANRLLLCFLPGVDWRILWRQLTGHESLWLRILL